MPSDAGLPPFPQRPSKPLPPWRLWWNAHHNLLAIWPQSAFVLRQFRLNFLTRRVIVINDPRSIRRVLIDNAANYCKGSVMQHLLQPLLGHGLLLSEGTAWQNQRQRLTPVFQSGRLAGFTETVTATTRQMLQRWSAEDGSGERELTQELARTTAMTICRALFQYDLSAPQAATAFHAFARYQDSFGRFNPLMTNGSPGGWRRTGNRAGRRALNQLDQLFQNIFDSHRPGLTGPADPIDLLLDAGMDPRQIRDEIATLFLAGHETTANALSWAFYLLAGCPEVEARLVAEIRQVLGGREPALADLPHLVYARAVIEETLRLYPPLPLLTRQALQPDRLWQQNIAAGTLIVIAPWIIQRHRLYWSEPDAFRPERFIGQTPRRYSYLPFAAGARGCPGSQFALSEAIVILVMVLQRYRLELQPHHPVEALGRITLRPGHGLPVRLTPRED
jgi:cytochrome P450